MTDVVTPLVSPSPGSSGAAVQPPQHLSQQPPMPVPTARNEKPRRVGVYTPSPGSPERVVLMNALRDAVRGDMGGDPIFVRDSRCRVDESLRARLYASPSLAISSWLTAVKVSSLGVTRRSSAASRTE